ncbi:hypothetical protein KI387_013236, partial [Taxus chinensis]
KNHENRLSPSPGSLGQLGRQGANRPKSRQAVHAAIGTSGRVGRKMVKRPKVEKIAKFSLRQVGQKYAADANRPNRVKQRTFVWDIRVKTTR